MNDHINTYFQSVREAYRLGNVESSYNAPIIALLAQFGCTARDMSGERSGQTGENVDIKLWHGDADAAETKPFAGVEVKKIGGIDARARGQIKSEAGRYGNAILTDNLVWQFWRSGEDRMYSGVQLIERSGDRLALRQDSIELFASLVGDFLLRDPAQIRSSSKLAEYMAMHAHTIRSVITGILKDGGDGCPLVDDRQKSLPMFPELYGLYSRIKGDLQPAMATRDFADMYAQTIVYGLFIARYNDASPEGFDRYEAIGHLQEESALLKQFFMHIAGSGKKHPTLETVIDKLCSLYRACDISGLLGRDGRHDTIVHFYEAFLTYYDPKLRKSLGVFYTPAPAVRYLVSKVDSILVEDFGIHGGLSNNDRLAATVPSAPYQPSKKKWSDTKEISVPRVAILDPAAGTGSFGAEIIRYVKETYFSGVREAFYQSYIQDEEGLLSRLIGFEIMMTSYVVAHLKIRRTIDETLGHAPDAPLPANIFLTNTLAPPHSGLERGDQMSLHDFSAAITDEAYHADTWKTRRPIKVVIGNPPYLAASTNPYDISAYKTETDGVTKLREKNPKWLGDDYVKFFRFAERIINDNGEGILAFVSNSGYLDNPTFRGMRASLLRTFDKIYVVNLHGSATKQEKTPDGGKDENIFDIMQGVSLFVGVKTASDSAWAKVFYADLWGTRESKFHALESGAPVFAELIPDRDTALFIPQNNSSKQEYDGGVSLVELFAKYSAGMVLGRDGLCVQNARKDVEDILSAFRTQTTEVLRLKYNLGTDTSDWSVKDAMQDIERRDGRIAQIAYRPFDNRWTYFTGRSKGFHCRPRGEIMKNFSLISATPIGKNIGLVFVKGDSTQNPFSMVFVVESIVDNRLTAAQTAGIASVAPLYLHSEIGDTWTPNLDPDALARLTEHMSEKPEPIEVFDYVYGVLHDPVYRERFNEFLKRDFPRVPVVNSKITAGDDVRIVQPPSPDAFHVSEDMFRAYAAAGGRLRELHLMQAKAPAALTIDPNTSDDMEIGSVRYRDGALHLNANKRIIGIPANVWDYRIGGYQVLDKWFKSHKGETLTIESFEHIENVAGLLAETIKVQAELRDMHGMASTSK
jgi:hypothetical protein